MTYHPQEGKTSPIIQHAATIMLLREHSQNGVEALIVKRNEKLKFAAGYWVFPGGKIELSEIEKSNSLDEAAELAAIRETEEETGLIVDKAELKQFVHWTTPTGGNRRYGTYFFYSWTDADEVIIDNSEIVDYQWVSAKRAFELLGKRKLQFLPPTFISLYRISPFDMRQHIDEELASGIPTVVPRTKFEEGVFYSFYEGDVAYISRDQYAIGPRHRIIGDLSNGKYDFQYEGCEHIFPVTGRSVLNFRK